MQDKFLFPKPKKVLEEEPIREGTVEYLLEFDNYLKVETLVGSSELPQTACWYGMRQCYADYAVSGIPKDKLPSESKCGELLIKHLLKGGRGHFSPLEHPKIVLDVSGFPHNVMQQLRTHRTGTSFSVCSGRYTSQQFIDVAKRVSSPESAFFCRPPGRYTNREGKKFTHSFDNYYESLEFKYMCCKRYFDLLELGYSEEHAREESLPWDAVRQPFVVGLNARSLMHILDLRAKKDAQLEIQVLSELLFREFKKWMPEIAEWYYQERFGKGRLSP